MENPTTQTNPFDAAWKAPFGKDLLIDLMRFLGCYSRDFRGLRGNDWKNTPDFLRESIDELVCTLTFMVVLLHPDDVEKRCAEARHLSNWFISADLAKTMEQCITSKPGPEEADT
jgi:hypothetical protein